MPTLRIRTQTGELIQTPLTRKEIEQMRRNGTLTDSEINQQLATLLKQGAYTAPEIQARLNITHQQLSAALQLLRSKNVTVKRLRDINTGRQYYTIEEE